MPSILPALVIALAATGSPAVADSASAPAVHSAADSNLIHTVVAFRDARKRNDTKAMKTLLSDDPRIWFEKKKGPGTKLTPGGRGPWSEWDEYFHANSRLVGDFTVKGRRVNVVVEETSDFYRLCERDARRYHAIYFLDRDNRVTGILIQPIENPAGRNRFDDVRLWLKKNHPKELNALMPDGEIVPSVENAERWRRLLDEWRASANLPPIQPEE